MKFPTLDELGRPTEKLPPCPQCSEDELSVIHHDFMMCYACQWKMRRCLACGGSGVMKGDARQPANSILRCDVNCPDCTDP